MTDPSRPWCRRSLHGDEKAAQLCCFSRLGTGDLGPWTPSPSPAAQTPPRKSLQLAGDGEIWGSFCQDSRVFLPPSILPGHNQHQTERVTLKTEKSPPSPIPGWGLGPGLLSYRREAMQIIVKDMGGPKEGL